jgi:hypothetical protein
MAADVARDYGIIDEVLPLEDWKGRGQHDVATRR